MKKWFISVSALLLLSFSFGAVLHHQYTKIDFSDPDQIADFSIRLLSAEDMFEEDTNGNEGQEMILETTDPYTNKEVTEIITNQTDTEDGNEKNVRRISWLDRWREELEQADTIALVESMGNTHSLAGTLQQEIKISKVYQGKLCRAGDVVQLINSMSVFAANEDKEITIGNLHTNFMQKGESYLVFLNQAHSKLRYLFYGASEHGLSYFNIKDQKEGYFDTKEVFVKYSDVRKTEFLCNDKNTYLQLKKVKNEILRKYL